MKVLSIFDGMACGMLAMMEAGIEVNRYVAYEIDKYAVQTSIHNFPTIEHRGDVFQADFTEFRGFDFLVGGSPCTYWSIAQRNNRETEASGMGWELFSQYVRALKEAQPMYFIYENNKSMSNAIRESITQTFGFEPICINSALVSAQNRNRLYWVGKRNLDGSYSRIKVEQPEDRGILLRDVLAGVHIDDCIGVGYRNRREADGKLYRRFETHGQTKSNALTTVQTDSMVAIPLTRTVLNVKPQNKAEEQKIMVPVEESVCMRYLRSEEAKRVRKQYEAGEIRHGFRELSELHPRLDGKTNTLSTVLKDNPICEPILYAVAYECDQSGKPIKAVSSADGKVYPVYEVTGGQITIKDKQYNIQLADGFYIIRTLTVSESKCLQTVPEWYEFPVSDSQAYKMLGNGWTVAVVAHLIKATQANELTEEQLDLFKMAGVSS